MHYLCQLRQVHHLLEWTPWYPTATMACGGAYCATHATMTQSSWHAAFRSGPPTEHEPDGLKYGVVGSLDAVEFDVVAINGASSGGVCVGESLDDQRRALDDHCHALPRCPLLVVHDRIHQLLRLGVLELQHLLVLEDL
ncbi:hypothetical protein A0H81_12913 [Grifola frondosa]|uniref:Uncharacterized protein n=1 Tax=Grifola frondosa TaxID=5627 RepID=A0A1C7LWR4_GRIFR|nr:hypothetical protein A0H81_12913 [Grifola frondosa]